MYVLHQISAVRPCDMWCLRATADVSEQQASQCITRLYRHRILDRCRGRRDFVTTVCRTIFFPICLFSWIYTRTDALISDDHHLWMIGFMKRLSPFIPHIYTQTERKYCHLIAAAWKLNYDISYHRVRRQFGRFPRPLPLTISLILRMCIYKKGFIPFQNYVPDDIESLQFRRILFKIYAPNIADSLRGTGHNIDHHVSIVLCPTTRKFRNVFWGAQLGGHVPQFVTCLNQWVSSSFGWMYITESGSHYIAFSPSQSR